MLHPIGQIADFPVRIVGAAAVVNLHAPVHPAAQFSEGLTFLGRDHVVTGIG